MTIFSVHHKFSIFEIKYVKKKGEIFFCLTVYYPTLSASRCRGVSVGGVNGHLGQGMSWYAISNWWLMWSRVESGSLCRTLTDLQSWKGILWDCLCMATDCGGEPVSIHTF